MFSLIKLVIKNSKAVNAPKDIKERILRILSFVIVFGSLSSVMIWASFYIVFRLKIINQTNAFSNILLLMNFFILLAESVFETLNSLYFSKDLKQFLTMPIKPWKLVFARIINIINQIIFVRIDISITFYNIIIIFFFVSILWHILTF